MEVNFQWSENGREELSLTLLLEEGVVKKVTMKAIGCMDFLEFSQTMKSQLTGTIDQITLPEGRQHFHLIWKEALLNLQNQWQTPVEHPEICHCRKVSTEKVDRAIVYGAHNIDEIRKRTSANTGCGTCLSDIDKLLEFRLK